LPRSQLQEPHFPENLEDAVEVFNEIAPIHSPEKKRFHSSNLMEIDVSSNNYDPSQNLMYLTNAQTNDEKRLQSSNQTPILFSNTSKDINNTLLETQARILFN
jgi:hypothetical protein